MVEILLFLMCVMMCVADRATKQIYHNSHQKSGNKILKTIKTVNNSTLNDPTCGGIPDCATCKWVGSEISCTSCYESYYLDNNSCKRCTPFCKKCESEIGCSVCDDGYYIKGTSCEFCGYGCLVGMCDQTK
ncbi:CXXC-rich protein, partial [Entamoeba invadens IP1]